MWTESLDDKKKEMAELKDMLKHLEQPFGFIEGFHLGKVLEVDVQARKDNLEEKKANAGFDHDVPPEVAAQLDRFED